MYYWEEKRREKIQEILNKGLKKYIEKNKVIGYKQKVIKAIKDCKTEKWEDTNMYVMNVNMKK